MALPNGAGGYQVGDGNLNEPVIGYLNELLVSRTVSDNHTTSTKKELQTGQSVTSQRTHEPPLLRVL